MILSSEFKSAIRLSCLSEHDLSGDAVIRLPDHAGPSRLKPIAARRVNNLVSAPHNMLAAVQQMADNNQSNGNTRQGVTLSEIWETKDGLRRVRRDPPTVDDAVLAAQGLTEDLDGQIEIVTALMSISAEEARRAVLKMRRSDSRLTISSRGGLARAVVVERKSPRRLTVQTRASVARRGLG